MGIVCVKQNLAWGGLTFTSRRSMTIDIIRICPMSSSVAASRRSGWSRMSNTSLSSPCWPVFIPFTCCSMSLPTPTAVGSFRAPWAALVLGVDGEPTPSAVNRLVKPSTKLKRRCCVRRMRSRPYTVLPSVSPSRLDEPVSEWVDMTLE